MTPNETATPAPYEKKYGEFNGTQVRVREFKGVKYVDIRKFFVEPKSGNQIPTKKGISFAVSMISDCIGLLEQAEHEHVVTK